MLLDSTNPLHYDIMTALRGPDDENKSVKSLFTGVLRFYVLPTIGEFGPRAGWPFDRHFIMGVATSPLFAREWWKDKVAATPSIHYGYHLWRAFDALARELPEKSQEIIDYWNWAITRVDVPQQFEEMAIPIEHRSV